MNILIILSILASIIMMTTNHPVMMTALILSQAVMMCILVWMMSSSSWFSFALFLIFVGGLMILFIYITSLASNEKFEMDVNSLMTPAIFTVISLTTVFYSEMNSFKVNKLMNSSNTLKMMFSETVNFTTMLIMSYLLITLIVVVKISSKMEGPIRYMKKF